MAPATLHHLPPELLWRVLRFLSLNDLASARLVCRKLRTLADHPKHWRHLELDPSQFGYERAKPDTPALWQLNHLQSLVGPHLKHVRTLRLYGVRDHVVRYILSNCPHLEELTLCGWTTLSDHAFKHTIRCTRLRKLELVACTPSNYTSIDATTLGRLLTSCPELEELLFGCHVHIHATSFLQSIRSKHLRRLTLATHRTWTSDHIATLMKQCPKLEQVSLVPSAASGVDLRNTNVKHWMDDKLKQALDVPATETTVYRRPA